VNIEVLTPQSTVDWVAIQDIFISVGWGDRGGIQYIEQAFRNSYRVWMARERDTVVGFVRALSDGVYYATLADFVVHASQQGRGTGSLLLRTALSNLKHIPTVQLMAVNEKQGYYERHGFKRVETSMARYLNPKKEQLFLLQNP